MDKELTELLAFVDRTRAEVAGRENAHPEDEHAERLIRFVRGKCTPDERQEVCELLRQNPTWLRWLAGQVKLGRDDKRPDPGES